MTDTPTEPGPAPAAVPAGPSRRGLLRLGAISASAIVTIRPALAQTAGSVLNCQIPLPDPARPGWIAANGDVVPAGTQGAFAGRAQAVTGEQVKAAMNGSPYPGAGYEASKAYTAYIKRLQQGQSGFTCYASLMVTQR